jgi:3-phenylpropionate/trans-cinnamate dioxygenase ferredoxin subunit
MSLNWIDVAAVEALGAGRLTVMVDGDAIVVVRVAGALHAFEDRCTHDGATLEGGELESDADDPAGGVVTCPRHGARFCLRTGAALSPPAYEPIRVYPVRTSGSRIEIAVE